MAQRGHSLTTMGATWQWHSSAPRSLAVAWKGIVRIRFAKAQHRRHRTGGQRHSYDEPRGGMAKHRLAMEWHRREAKRKGRERRVEATQGHSLTRRRWHCSGEAERRIAMAEPRKAKNSAAKAQHGMAGYRTAMALHTAAMEMRSQAIRRQAVELPSMGTNGNGLAKRCTATQRQSRE